jgi:hypothetical protein
MPPPRARALNSSNSSISPAIGLFVFRRQSGAHAAGAAAPSAASAARSRAEQHVWSVWLKYTCSCCGCDCGCNGSCIDPGQSARGANRCSARPRTSRKQGGFMHS